MPNRSLSVQSPALEDEEECNRFRFQANNATVRIDEDMYGVTVTIEGEIASTETSLILEKFRDRLTNIESANYVVNRTYP